MKSHHRTIGLAFVSLSVLLLLNGCATAWKQESTFYKTTQTLLTVESNPSGDVFVNNRAAGRSPLTIPLNYEREYARKNRKVTYWITQPGWAVFLTVASLGVYLPISAIPVDVETTFEPKSIFKGNEFHVRIVAEGYTDWEDVFVLSGQGKHSLQPTLKRIGANQ